VRLPVYNGVYGLETGIVIAPFKNWHYFFSFEKVSRLCRLASQKEKQRTIRGSFKR
jgi:hypothetical protein